VKKLPLLRTAVLVGLLLAALPALAEPAAIPDAAHQRAERSLEEFASEWMGKVRTLELKARVNPTVKAGPSDPVFTYRGYGDEYSVELRPTGHPRAPYVGLLRYTEHVYSCESMRGLNCSVASSVPVTEIFRYKNGSWAY
jgi:hypothetical protein